MYFQIEGSKVRLAGTMHRVPKGNPLAAWVNEAVDWARLIYIEHEEDTLRQGQAAAPGSLALAQRLPVSWSRIERDCRRDLVVQFTRLRPRAVISYLLKPVPLDGGVEHLAIAKSKDAYPPGSRIAYLETMTQYLALDDGVRDAVWDEAVSWAMNNPASSVTLLESSYAAWIAGDIDAIDRISSSFSVNRFQAIKEATIDARNRLWLPTICDLVKFDAEPTLVLVGVAHLGGTDGLISLLTARGLTLSAAS